MRALRRALLVTASFLFLACKKDVATEPPVVEKTVRFKEDPSLGSVLRNLATVCKIDEQSLRVECPSGEYQKELSARAAAAPNPSALLETATVLTESKEDSLRRVTLNFAHDSTRAGLGPDARSGSISADLVKVLIERLKGLTDVEARLLVVPAVHAAVVSEQTETLFAALEGRPAVAPEAYRNVMVHGRLDQFPRIRELVKSENSAIRLAAIDAPRNMPKWSEKDRAEICPWAKELLADTRPMIASRALGLLGRCGGEYITKMLEFAKSSKEGLGRGDIPAFRDLCVGSASLANDQQCEANRALLTAIARDKKADERVRSLALSAVVYQWPDKTSLLLAGSFEHDASKYLVESAHVAKQRLEQRLKAETRQK